jgi:hypothetical protein
MALPTHDGAAEVVEPGKDPFDLPTPAISPQRTAVLCWRPDAVGAMWGDQFDALLSESAIKRIAVVGKIPDKSLGSSHSDGLSEGIFDKGDFMWRSRSRVDGEWKTRSICNHHELRTFAPLGFSDFRAPFLATLKDPSMKHSDRSMPPRSSKSLASASMTERSTPSPTHRWNRRWQVWYGGKRSGRSDQGAPVRSTQRMPFMTWRLSFHGRPRPSARRGSTGINGSSTTHCSSVNSSALLIPCAPRFQCTWNHSVTHYL